METNKPAGAELIPPGIVIQHPATQTLRPAISAFIWGGKVSPTPALPYGRSKA